MKKMNLRYALLALPLFAIAIFSTAFKADPPGKKTVCQVCPTNTCPFTPCCNWVTPNLMNSVSGGIETFTLAVCNTVTATPSWTSSNQLGTAPSYMWPSANRSFTATTTGGAIFSCTITTTGVLTVQQTSGPAPGRGANITGSYAL